MKPKNLDVLGTSQDAENTSVKDVERNRRLSAHSISLCAPIAQPHHQQRRRRYRSGGSKYITEQQTAGIIQAVRFAKSLDLPLVAHLTIHWACTDSVMILMERSSQNSEKD